MTPAPRRATDRRGTVVNARTTSVEGDPRPSMPGDVDVVRRHGAMPHARRRLAGTSACPCWRHRTYGPCIATSAWETEEATAGTTTLRRCLPARGQRPRAVTGRSSPRIAEWSRSRPCTAITGRERAVSASPGSPSEPDLADRGIDVFKIDVDLALDELEVALRHKLPGGPESGWAVSSTAYDSAEALAHNQSRIDEPKAASHHRRLTEVLDTRLRVGDRPSACARDVSGGSPVSDADPWRQQESPMRSGTRAGSRG